MVARPELDEFDTALLEHVGRYRISFRCIMERLFGQNSSPTPHIKKLARAKLIASDQGGKSEYAVWHLTYSGCRAAGVPKDRAEVLQRERSLPEAFKVLWLCCVHEPKLTRLDDAHVRGLLGDDITTRNRVYCADTDDYRLWRVHIPSDRTAVESVLKNIREDYRALKKLPGSEKFFRTRRYGSLILVTKEQRANRFKLHLKECDLHKTGPVKNAVVPAWDERHLRLKEWTRDG